MKPRQNPSQTSTASSRHAPQAAAATPARRLATVLLAATLGLLGTAAAAAVTPTELLDGYRATAGTAPSAARGQKLFTTPQGHEWSCSSCHGPVPTQTGKHAATGKPITPLAPAFNPQRFSDPAKVEKWFRRNCNDVVGRECSAVEKADVLAWLVTLKP